MGLFRRLRKKLKGVAQASNKTPAAEEQTAPNTFTSEQGTPVTENATLNAQAAAEQSNGLLGNVRKTLFAGGVSSGGIFSYGKRQTKLFS